MTQKWISDYRKNYFFIVSEVVAIMEKEKRTEFISFRVSPQEKCKFRNYAEKQGCSLGKMIRSAAVYMIAVAGSEERGRK